MNMFYVRSFSPFARAYPPALAELPNPIMQDEFLAFIDGLNNAFMMHPFFQAAFMAGGMVMSAPLLPVQIAGGGLQAIAALGSGAVTLVRGKAYLKQANAATFHPRGLTAQLCTTRKMMAAVGLSEAKLTLPPLDDVDDLDFGPTHAAESSLNSSSISPEGEKGEEDPRMRRLRALQGHVSPLTFDVPQAPLPAGALKRYATAPTRWMNGRNERGLAKGREKGRQLQRDKAAALDGELGAASREVDELERRLAAAQEAVGEQYAANEQAGGARERDDRRELVVSLERRAQIVEEIRRAGEKKIRKSDRKEERIANRILWVVITRSEDAPPEDEELELSEMESSSH